MTMMRRCILLASSLFWLSSAFLDPKLNVRRNARQISLQQASTTDTAMRTDDADPSDILMDDSSTLGTIHRIRMPGQDDSFVQAMGVPTFAAHNCTLEATTSTTQRRRGLEGALGQGPAFVLDNVLSESDCQEIIQTCDQLGFEMYKAGKNNHGAMQIVVSSEMADTLAQRISRHVDLCQVDERRCEMMKGDDDDASEDRRLFFAGLNRRWRIYRYAPGGEESFAPHIDAGFPPSGLSQDGQELVWDTSNGEIVSRLTVLFYLNDDFVGGETNFYQPKAHSGSTFSVIASVRPVAGSCLVFPQGVGEEAVDYARQHWPLHEGSRVISGNAKYVIRSDILFMEQRERLPLDDKLFRYDHLVRKTFLPESLVMDHNFVRHLDSLYNPHMGVENMGPFLYSFIRLTKKRQIVEIGAGYTSVWILQALKDNDDELKRIRELQQNGQCRLLDCPWTVADIVQNYDNEPAALLCIDNCEHQKETATGASAVSRALGLDKYMRFMKGDAFELQLEPNSVDILWCDFGVGSRMKEFASSAWSSIRPGGYLLCHSTLTNRRTREWLEDARSRKGQELTGIPPDEYVEVSLLEPHKRFQNSISILQKRKGYMEPVHSEYA